MARPSTGLNDEKSSLYATCSKVPSPSASTSIWMRPGTIGVGRRENCVTANWRESPRSRTPTLARSMMASFDPGEPGCPAAGAGSRPLEPVSVKASTMPSSTPRLRNVTGAVPSGPGVTLRSRATVEAARFGSACQPSVAWAPPDESRTARWPSTSAAFRTELVLPVAPANARSCERLKKAHVGRRSALMANTIGTATWCPAATTTGPGPTMVMASAAPASDTLKDASTVYVCDDDDVLLIVTFFITYFLPVAACTPSDRLPSPLPGSPICVVDCSASYG